MIKIKNLTKSYKNFTLNIEDFQIPKGEYHIMLGSTGAGKSLLAKLTAGFIKPDKGTILINSQDVTKLLPEKRNIAYIPQTQNLFPHMNVLQNIEYGLRFKKTGKSFENQAAYCSGIISKLNIQNLVSRTPASLSGGEKQKAALARALAPHPEAIILDEPLSAVDKASRLSFHKILKQLNKEEKITFIHITHDHSEAFCLGDRISFIHKGCILQTDTPENIFRKPKTIAMAKFLGIENIFSGFLQKSGSNLFFIAGPFSFIIPEHLHKHTESLTDSIKLMIEPEKIFIPHKNSKSHKNLNCFDLFLKESYPLNSRLIKAVFTAEKTKITDNSSIHVITTFEKFKKREYNKKVRIIIDDNAFHFVKE